jgi:hypothetical protein
MITKQEAKEKCIKMWEYIAEHITDKEWRDGRSGRYDIKAMAYGGQPYNSFGNHIKAYKYARASAAATRLVEKVKKWEVDLSVSTPKCGYKYCEDPECTGHDED